MAKDLRSGRTPEVVQKESGLPRFALVPEDVPIDLGVIATRIETAPHCRIINAALQPLLREVLVILLAGCRCQPVQQRAVDVLWGPQWALTECVQWGERRQWSHLRFSGAVSFLRSICRTRLEVVAATGR